MLYTHLTIRDDAHLLYGFGREHERALFRALIKVNGVGPKLALAILSGMDEDAFMRCVRDDDSKALTKLPGVGKKNGGAFDHRNARPLSGLGAGQSCSPRFRSYQWTSRA